MLGLLRSRKLPLGASERLVERLLPDLQPIGALARPLPGADEKRVVTGREKHPHHDRRPEQGHPAPPAQT
ncbi:MAG: hypothetical protein ABIQ41_06585 [Gemmatimonadales bacterium]